MLCVDGCVRTPPISCWLTLKTGFWRIAFTGLVGVGAAGAASAMISPFSAADASSNAAAFLAFLLRENMQPSIGRMTSMTMTPPAAMPAQTPISSLTILIDLATFGSKVRVLW